LGGGGSHGRRVLKRCLNLPLVANPGIRKRCLTLPPGSGATTPLVVLREVQVTHVHPMPTITPSTGWFFDSIVDELEAS